MESVWKFKDAMEARVDELRPYVKEYEEIQRIIDVLGRYGDKAKTEVKSADVPQFGVDPLYNSAIRYSSYRPVITQRMIARFFNIGKRRAKALVDQMVKEGHVKPYSQKAGGYQTNRVSERKKYTVTSETEQITVTTEPKPIKKGITA